MGRPPLPFRAQAAEAGDRLASRTHQHMAPSGQHSAEHRADRRPRLQDRRGRGLSEGRRNSSPPDHRRPGPTQDASVSNQAADENGIVPKRLYFRLTVFSSGRMTLYEDFARETPGTTAPTDTYFAAQSVKFVHYVSRPFWDDAGFAAHNAVGLAGES